MISSVRSRTSESLAIVLRTSEARSSGVNALSAPVYLNRAFAIAGLGRSALFRVTALFRITALFSVGRLMASGAPLA
jgi:hypothetical protein